MKDADFTLSPEIPDASPPLLQHGYGTLDLRLADCMDVMREFSDGYFDLAIVDPPYGIGVNSMNMGGVIR